MNSATSPGGSAPLATALTAVADWPLRCGAVPPLADRFTARTETAPDLRLALERDGIVALVGQASRNGTGSAAEWQRCSGKTQLAVSFAQAQWQAGAIDLLLWVDASSRAAVLTGYAEAARAITGAQLYAFAEPAAAGLLAWLSQADARWLLVLDDLSDASILDDLLPSGRTGRVLITASSPQAVVGLPDALLLEIGPFSPREAMTYLVTRLSRDPDQRRGAMDLISDIGCHPVALGQATATIASSWITCAEYSQQYARRQAQLRGPGGPPAAPAVTWTLAVDQADQLVPGGAAQFCLALAAMLDGHSIPATVLSTPAASQYIVGDGGRPAQAAQIAQRALGSLSQADLLSIDSSADPPIVRMSQILQRSVRAAMSAEMLGEAARSAAAALADLLAQTDERTPVAHMLRSSALALLRGAGDTIWTDGCPALLLQAGQSLDSAGLPGPAVEFWREVSASSDRMLGVGHPDSLALLERLAAACKRAGRMDDALAAHRRIVDDRARTLGAQHAQTLSAQVSLGRALVDAAQYSEAIAVLDAALADSESRRAASDPGLLGLRDQLAAAQVAAGYPDKAVRLLRGTLAERERSQGPAHRDTIATRQSLAEAYLAEGRVKDAVSQYKRALSDSERLDGPDDRGTLRIRIALATAYQRAGRMSNAVSMYEVTRAACERALGPDDPDTLAASVSLARTYAALGHLGNAATLLRSTLARCEVVLPPGDAITRLAQETLAGL